MPYLGAIASSFSISSFVGGRAVVEPSDLKSGTRHAATVAGLEACETENAPQKRVTCWGQQVVGIGSLIGLRLVFGNEEESQPVRLDARILTFLKATDVPSQAHSVTD